jgi:hypothetical protein
MPVNVVGACTSEWVRKSSDTQRDAYMAVWKYITGYDRFLMLWNDERWMSKGGITAQPVVASDD